MPKRKRVQREHIPEVLAQVEQDELVAPTLVLHYDYPAGSPGVAKTQSGPEAIKHFVSLVRTTFPDYHFTKEEELRAGILRVHLTP